MTTAAPPRALLTPSPGPRRRERAPAPGGHLLLGQHTQCETLGSGEGSCAPLRTPGSRAAAGAPDARGRQPPNPRTGARLAQRRTAVVATHVTLANQAAVGAAEALLLPNVGERANDAVSGLGEPRIAALDRIEDHPAAGDVTGSRLPPPTGGLLAFPQGSLAPQARAGSDPESGKRGGNSRPWPGRPSGGWRGVTPSPTTRKNAGRGFAGLRAKRNGVTGFRQRRWMREAAKAAAKGGCCPLAATRRPRKLRNRRQKPCPARRCRRQILAGPVSRGSRAPPGAGDRSGRDPCRRASRPSRGHPDGGGTGRRTQVRYVPDAAPRRADRDPGPRRRGSCRYPLRPGLSGR